MNHDPEVYDAAVATFSGLLLREDGWMGAGYIYTV